MLRMTEKDFTSAFFYLSLQVSTYMCHRFNKLTPLNVDNFYARTVPMYMPICIIYLYSSMTFFPYYFYEIVSLTYWLSLFFRTTLLFILRFPISHISLSISSISSGVLTFSFLYILLCHSFESYLCPSLFVFFSLPF